MVTGAHEKILRISREPLHGPASVPRRIMGWFEEMVSFFIIETVMVRVPPCAGFFPFDSWFSFLLLSS